MTGIWKTKFKKFISSEISPEIKKEFMARGYRDSQAAVQHRDWGALLGKVILEQTLESGEKESRFQVKGAASAAA